jgi:hypothetical protein
MSSTVVAALSRAAEALDGMSEIDWYWQHGDFSLNNLIVARDSVAVIDWDEFGATAVPLQDELGLAWSVSQLSAGSTRSSAVSEDISSCVKFSLTILPEATPYVSQLFLHYLVWRVNRAYGFERRSRERAKLIAMLEAIAFAGLP